LTTQRVNVFGDPTAQERFEGFGHTVIAEFPRLRVSLPALSDF
jgi:hypothetical protein